MTVPAPSTAAAPIGKVDQFDVLVELGSGGMGTVYRAWDRSLGRSVAVKAIAAHLVSDEVQLERFRREARLAAQISHPHVARVFGAGRWGDRPYIAMEFIDGENLQNIVSGAGAMKADEPPSLEGQVAGLTAERWAILRRMLAKKKEDRYGDYDSLLEDLRREQPGAARSAGLGTRMAAELMNWILQVLLVAGGLSITMIATRTAKTLPRELSVISTATLCVGVLAHYCWGIGRRGKTLGKHWMKLRVTRPDGQRIGYLRAALRFLLTHPWFFAYAPFLITGMLQLPGWLDDVLNTTFWCNMAILALSALFAWRHPQRRMLHDLLSDTIVVRIPEPEKER